MIHWPQILHKFGCHVQAALYQIARRYLYLLGRSEFLKINRMSMLIFCYFGALLALVISLKIEILYWIFFFNSLSHRLKQQNIQTIILVTLIFCPWWIPNNSISCNASYAEFILTPSYQEKCECWGKGNLWPHDAFV